MENFTPIPLPEFYVYDVENIQYECYYDGPIRDFIDDDSEDMLEPPYYESFTNWACNQWLEAWIENPVENSDFIWNQWSSEQKRQLGNYIWQWWVLEGSEVLSAYMNQASPFCELRKPQDLIYRNLRLYPRGIRKF